VAPFATVIVIPILTLLLVPIARSASKLKILSAAAKPLSDGL
jgi:hypothetical protein